MASSMEVGENLQQVVPVPVLDYNLEARLPFFFSI